MGLHLIAHGYQSDITINGMQRIAGHEPGKDEVQREDSAQCDEVIEKPLRNKVSCIPFPGVGRATHY
jgi:hypothetical protein